MSIAQVFYFFILNSLKHVKGYQLGVEILAKK